MYLYFKPRRNACRYGQVSASWSCCHTGMDAGIQAMDGNLLNGDGSTWKRCISEKTYACINHTLLR